MNTPIRVLELITTPRQGAAAGTAHYCRSRLQRHPCPTSAGHCAAAVSLGVTFEQILGNAGHTVVHLMLALQTIAHPQIVTPTWVRAYASHFTGRADCRGVIRFPQQLVAPQSITPDPDAVYPPVDPDAIAAVRAKPAMLVEGMRDTALLPRHMIPAFQATFPHAPVIELPDAGHFTPEDAPETLLALVKAFMKFTATRPDHEKATVSA